MKRPDTLKEVIAESASLADFGRNFRDWLHRLRHYSSRRQVARSIAETPPRGGGRFEQGEVADAYVAAYAELIATRLKLPPPAWVFDASRVSATPWFAEGADVPALRQLSLLHSPLPFKRRNLFTRSVELPLHLRSGRPAKSAEEKRRVNAARQRRHRQRWQAELRKLRKLAKRAGA